MKQILTFMLFTMMMVPLVGATRRHHRVRGAKPHQSRSLQFQHVQSGKRLTDPLCWQDVKSVVSTAEVGLPLTSGWFWITCQIRSIISTINSWITSSASLVAREFASAPPSPSEKRINTWRPGFLRAQKKHAKRMGEQNVPVLKPVEEPIKEEPAKIEEREEVEELSGLPEELLEQREVQEQKIDQVKSCSDGDCKKIFVDPVESEEWECTTEPRLKDLPESVELKSAIEQYKEPVSTVQPEPIISELMIEEVEPVPVVSHELKASSQDCAMHKSGRSLQMPTVAELQQYDCRKQKGHCKRTQTKQNVLPVHNNATRSERDAELSNESLGSDTGIPMIKDHKFNAFEKQDLFDYYPNPSANQSSHLSSMQPYPSMYAPAPSVYQQQPMWSVQQQPAQFPVAYPYQQPSQQLSSIAMQLQSSAMAMQAQAATLIAQAQQQYMQPMMAFQYQPISLMNQMQPMPSSQQVMQQFNAPGLSSKEKTRQLVRYLYTLPESGEHNVQRLLLLIDLECDIIEQLLAGNAGRIVDKVVQDRNMALKHSNQQVVAAYNMMLDLATTYNDGETDTHLYHHFIRKSKRETPSPTTVHGKRKFLMRVMYVFEHYYDMIEKMQQVDNLAY